MFSDINLLHHLCKSSITIVLYYLTVVLTRGVCNSIDLLDLLLDLYCFDN